MGAISVATLLHQNKIVQAQEQKQEQKQVQEQNQKTNISINQLKKAKRLRESLISTIKIKKIFV